MDLIAMALIDLKQYCEYIVLGLVGWVEQQGARIRCRRLLSLGVTSDNETVSTMITITVMMRA